MMIKYQIIRIMVVGLSILNADDSPGTGILEGTKRLAAIG